MSSLIVVLFLGFSSLVYSSESLTNHLNEIRTKAGIPGMVVSSYKDSQEYDSAVSGFKKSSNEQPIEKSDKLHLGSITKSMTATLIGKLVEENKLKWNSTLSELFEEIDIHTDLKGVTVEMILAHRAGFIRNLQGFNIYIDPSLKTNKEKRSVLSQTILKMSPNLKPGSEFSYSNTGYLILGHIIERITGIEWDQYIKEELFNPLGMNSCGLGFPGEDQPWGHSYNQDHIIQPSSWDNHSFWGPAGSAHCSVDDIQKYFTMHINGFNGLDGLVSALTFSKLHTSYPGQTYTYGGWFRLERKWASGPVLTHSGTNEKNMAYVWLAPKKNASYFGFANLGGDETDKENKKGSEKAARAIDEILSILIK